MMTFPHRAPVSLLGVAFGRGGSDPGAADGPGALKAMGLLDYLQEAGTAADWSGFIRDPLAGTSAMAAAAEVGARIAAACGQEIGAGRRLAVIGGDHSCAVGTWSGVARTLKREERLGLLWIDAHLDSHTPATTHTGTVHGMPVAALLGHGDPRLVSLPGDRPALRPEDVCMIGARDYEPEEPAFLSAQGVRVYFAEEVKARGLTAVIDEALTHVSASTSALGVSLDLDVVDPYEAPGVGCRVPGGVSGEDLVRAVGRIRTVVEPAAWELVEFNPHRDRHGKTADLAKRLLAEAFR